MYQWQVLTWHGGKCWVLSIGVTSVGIASVGIVRVGVASVGMASVGVTSSYGYHSFLQLDQQGAVW